MKRSGELEEDAVGLSGKPPEEFRSLVEMMLHRRRLKRLGVSVMSVGLVETELKVALNFIEGAPINPAAMMALVTAEPKNLEVRPDGRLVLKNDDAQERGITQSFTWYYQSPRSIGNGVP